MSIISFIGKVCVQTAVYWGNPVNDGRGGYTFGSAVEISCRWDDVSEEITDSNGEQILCSAKVLLTQDVSDQGWLYLGSLDDSQMDSDPQPMDIVGAHKIIRIVKTPLFKSTDQFVRTVYLSTKRNI